MKWLAWSLLSAIFAVATKTALLRLGVAHVKATRNGDSHIGCGPVYLEALGDINHALKLLDNLISSLFGRPSRRTGYTRSR